MPPSSEVLGRIAAAYLERQPWFRSAIAGEGRATIELVRDELVRDGSPGLSRLLLRRGERHFQLLVGWRAEVGTGVLRNEEGSLLGAAASGDDEVVVYDALADDELCRVILEVATAGAESGQRVRAVTSLVSHASLVFDERLFVKVYRVLEAGSRPEIEVLFGLQSVGFDALLTPASRWQDGEFDLALVRRFLPSALEGRLLALTSLRDLLGHVAQHDDAELFVATDPDAAAAAAGGDLAGEMTRLGETTARLHVALEEAFGAEALALPALTERLRAGSSGTAPAVEALLVDGHGDYGRSIRLHGDYHLRRVMRAESGWIIAGFADDPLYQASDVGPSLPGRTGSPLEDLADMSFALGRLAHEALSSRTAEESELGTRLALGWWRRNRQAFLRGYLSNPEVLALLPGDPERTDVMLAAFEEVREARYEATSAEE